MRSSHLPFKISTVIVVSIILLFSSQNVFAQSGWIEITPSSSTAELKNIFIFDSNKVAIETNSNYFLFSWNGGMNWSKKFIPRDTNLTLVGYCIADSQTVYGWTKWGFHNEPSSLYRSSDFGDSWIKVWSAGDQYNINIDTAKFFNSSIGYLTLFSGSAYLTTYKSYLTNDGGNTWNLRDSSYEYYVTNFGHGSETIGIYNYFNERIIYGDYRHWYSAYFGGGGFNYYHAVVTTDGYLSWHSIMDNSSANFSLFKFSSPDSLTAFIASSRGLKKWSNQNFTLEDISNLPFVFIHFRDLRFGYAYLNAQGNILHLSSDSGRSWNNTITFVTSVKEIKFLNSKIGFLICEGGKIYKTTTGGGLGIALKSSEIPIDFSLSQNYPNPFNPTTKINFDLKSTAFAMLRVYDITGREVRTLVNEKLAAGSYSYDFNASELPSGVYFYQLQADGFIETKKMILLK